jgi:RNA polymerase sigma-70 factor, ECF subfamily
MDTEGSSAPGLTAELTLDPQRFAAVYQESLPAIYGYFLHRCGGRVSAAEDLTQETFVAAVAELRRGTRVQRPLPWLYGIARHKLLDHYRRNDRDARRLAPDAPVDPRDTALDDEWPRARAIEALARIAPSQRAALVLRHMDGLSVPEVATELGRSVEATESLLSRGRESFRRAFREAVV